MFRSSFKTILNKGFQYIDEQLHKVGMSITRIRKKKISVDDIAVGRTLLYKTRLEAVDADLPLSKARVGLHAMKMQPQGHINYLALTYLQELDDGYSLERLKSILVMYSRNNADHLKSLSDLYDISCENSSYLKKVPAWFTVYPWSGMGHTEEEIERRNFSTLIENKKRGGPALDAISGGSQYPLTNKKRAEFEAELLHKLKRSISKIGYKPKAGNFDPIGAIVLVGDDGEWCWMVNGGIHRTCVLAAMKYKTVIGSVLNIVYRRDVSDWPNVRNGTFTEEGALQLFDRVMAGDGYKCHNVWVANQFKAGKIFGSDNVQF